MSWSLLRGYGGCVWSSGWMCRSVVMLYLNVDEETGQANSLVGLVTQRYRVIVTEMAGKSGKRMITGGNRV